MSDGILSQEEIDALIGAPEGGSSKGFGELDIDALAEIVRLATESGVERLSELLKADASARFAASATGTVAELIERDKGSQVTVTVKLGGDVQGAVYYLFSEQAAAGMAAMALGRPTGESVLSDDLMNAFHKGMEELGARFASTVSTILAAEVDVEVGLPARLDLGEIAGQEFPMGPGDSALRCSFNLSIGREKFDFEVWLPIETATSLLSALSDQLDDEPAQAPPQPAQAKVETERPGPMPSVAGKSKAKTAPSRARSSAFEPMDFGQGMRGAEPGNLDFLLDVPLQVTVELGRTRMQIRDVLDLGKGSVIELDKLAGELVEIFVNGKLIAKGEVVTIDENFGVKITDIVSRRERVNNLQ